MKMHEYQAKELLSKYGIPIPPGRIAMTSAEAAKCAVEFGVPVAIKPQVLTRGPERARGVRIAQSAVEAEATAAAIFEMRIEGQPISKVLVTPVVSIAREIYLGAILDRSSKHIVFVSANQKELDIEEAVKTTSEMVCKVMADPFLGLSDFQARQLAFGISLPARLVPEFTRIAKSLYSIFLGCDASLVEINPLIITKEGSLIALDSKILLDDNGLVRHPDLAAERPSDDETPYDQEARKRALAYVKLDGSIGCMVNGAGLAMATMDMIKLHGSRPANFLDIGGGSKAERVGEALRLILSDPDVKAVLVNIFGGITRCDEVAKGVVLAMQNMPTDVPIVVRLAGTNEEEGRRIVAEAKIHAVASLREAAQRVVELSRA